METYNNCLTSED